MDPQQAPRPPPRTGWPTASIWVPLRCVAMSDLGSSSGKVAIRNKWPQPLSEVLSWLLAGESACQCVQGRLALRVLGLIRNDGPARPVLRGSCQHDCNCSLAGGESIMRNTCRCLPRTCSRPGTFRTWLDVRVESVISSKRTLVSRSDHAAAA